MDKSLFSSLGLSDVVLSNLDTLGYTQMTPIQLESLPIVLAGDDLIGQAKTGSGKTVAFALGLLSRLEPTNFSIQALVICPTRELADQVANEVRRLARAIPNIKVMSICGGVALGPQANSLESGAHIVVGTPGRLEDHIVKQSINLSEVTTLVLDEADRMLDMGFQDSLDTIIDDLPSRRQTLLFSATFPPTIEAIAGRVMSQPKMVKVDDLVGNLDIDQRFHKVDNSGRLKAIHLLIMEHEPESSLIFCNTKQEVQYLKNSLDELGFGVLSLHGDLEQRDRDLVLTRFANKSASILVATDVAARGLDIDAVDVVINYQVARDSEVHVHRVGRTGRAGNSGKAFTLYTDSEAFKLKTLGEQIGMYIENEPLPAKTVLNKTVPRPAMITLQINGGKKQKVRPGDILGALTGEAGLKGSDVGKIKISTMSSYVAVERSVIKQALVKLQNGKIKGRNFKVRSL